jgi:hypothetical protein
MPANGRDTPAERVRRDDEDRSTMQMTGTTLRNKNTVLVGRLYQAYVAIMLAPEGKNGARTVSLARYGAFEVRLTEFRTGRAADASSFWLELYRHDARASLDGCYFGDLLDAETVVEHFMLRAGELHEAHAGSGLSTPSNVTRSSSGNFFDSSL